MFKNDVVLRCWRSINKRRDAYHRWAVSREKIYVHITHVGRCDCHYSDSHALSFPLVQSACIIIFSSIFKLAGTYSDSSWQWLLGFSNMFQDTFSHCKMPCILSFHTVAVIFHCLNYPSIIYTLMVQNDLQCMLLYRMGFIYVNERSHGEAIHLCKH